MEETDYDEGTMRCLFACMQVLRVTGSEFMLLPRPRVSLGWDPCLIFRELASSFGWCFGSLSFSCT